MRATLSIFITGIGVALLVVSATLVAVGYTAYSAAGSLLLDKAVSLGVEPGAAATLVPIMTILITPLLTGALISASFGRVLNRSVATVVIGLVVVGFSYYAFTKDWLFDSRAKSIAYLCPPQGSDGKPRVSWRSVDNIFGIPCTPITPEIAPAIVALRQGVEPTKLIFTSTAELDALQTHKFGRPVVFVGSDGELRNGFGWDRRSPSLLRAVTTEDIARKRASLEAVETKRLAEIKQIEVAEAQAQKLKLADEEKKKSEALAEERRAAEAVVSAVPVIPVTTNIVATPRQALVNAKMNVANLPARPPAYNYNTSYYVPPTEPAAPRRDTFLVAWSGNASNRDQTTIEAALFANHEATHQRFSTARGNEGAALANPEEIINGNYSSLNDADSFGDLAGLVVLRLDSKRCENGRWVYYVSAARYVSKLSTVKTSTSIIVS